MSTDIFRRYIDIVSESAAHAVTEMDKSQPSHGRDSHVSHSTYGSRDKEGSEYFKGKESPGKAITVKQAEKDAVDILKKQGVAEGLDQPKEAGKAIQSLKNLAVMKSALTMQQLTQAGREAIVSNAIDAAKTLEQKYLQNKQQGNAIFVRALRDEIDNFMRGAPINASFPETDNASELGDLLQGKLGKVNFQQGVAEGGPFSYGAKKPRKGSVADLADKKRQEHEREKQPIEPKDQMVGVAKVTKGVAEGKVSGYKMYPNHDGTWYVEDENENVVLRNASKGEAEYAVWTGNEKLKQGVAEDKRTLRDYIAESEHAWSKPVPGDYFAINIREETLFETWVCDETNDGIVIFADETGMRLLEQHGYLGDAVMEQHGHDDFEADSDGSDVDVVDQGEYDFEGDQAKDQLRTIVRAARRLNGMLDDDDNLPEWVQMKITKAEDYIDTAADYMESNREQGVTEGDMAEAKYQGREVPLGKPMAGDVKKSKVYVRGPKGNVVKVNFGQKGMKIKKSIPGRRKNFRARHNCDNPGPRWKARYWSCRAW